MVTSLFGDTRVRADKQEAEARLVEQMEPILRSMPGFISYKHYTADDGEVVAIIRFETRDQLEAWVHEGRHGKLQAVANEYYESFWVQSAEVYKEYYWQGGVKTMDEMTSFFREADHLAESGRSH
jgi:antibiotic biosynthesis monooxygenase (ABM) superfamily enzyme